MLLRGPGHGLGGPVLHVVVLAGSGALLVVSIVALVKRGLSGR